MLHPDTFPFLRELAVNNNRDWFLANKSRWDAIRAQFLQIVTELIAYLSALDPAIGTPKASACIYRINRDLRFTTDKRPYKTWISFYIPTCGTKRTGLPGYYAQFDPAGEYFCGGGIFAPDGNALKAIYQEIFYNTDQLKAIINDPNYQQWYGSTFWTTHRLVTVPKGYPRDWPDADLLRYKDYCCLHNMTANEALSPNLTDYLKQCLSAAVPFNKFLQEALFEL